MADRMKLGNATVTRVVETRIEMRTSLFGETPQEAWEDNADVLDPTFWDRQTDQWKIAMQTWVVEVDGLTVVVDTGVGNDRNRPRMPPMDHLNTDFLSGLRGAGFDPADVDVVINTHLHTDHVGWNTHRVDGEWVPTFPNARYLMPEPDYRYFAPDGPGDNEPCESCSRTASYPSKTRWSSGPTTTRSASRCDCGPHPAIRRGRPWCGWKRAGPRSSSAI